MAFTGSMVTTFITFINFLVFLWEEDNFPYKF